MKDFKAVAKFSSHHMDKCGSMNSIHAISESSRNATNSQTLHDHASMIQNQKKSRKMLTTRMTAKGRKASNLYLDHLKVTNHAIKKTRDGNDDEVILVSNSGGTEASGSSGTTATQSYEEMVLTLTKKRKQVDSRVIKDGCSASCC